MLLDAHARATNGTGVALVGVARAVARHSHDARRCCTTG